MIKDQAGTSGALIKMEGLPSGGMGTLVYLACEEFAGEANRMVKAGGKIKDKKTPIGECGFTALAFDSVGNLIGLHSMQ